MEWIISANGKKYDHESAFAKWGFIDWCQVAKYSVGDFVYIYCTKPIQKIMYKTIVEAINLSANEIVNDEEFWVKKTEYTESQKSKFCRLTLLEENNSDLLSLDKLKLNGLKSAPQGPVKVHYELSNYLKNNFNDYVNDGFFPSTMDEYVEGASIVVLTNKYERSSKARTKCLEMKGYVCSICNFDFEQFYGEIGRNFIHVHHIVPISQINKSYKIDYYKDLIPLCPNCHAMLHRKFENKYLSVEELKKIVTLPTNQS